MAQLLSERAEFLLRGSDRHWILVEIKQLEAELESVKASDKDAWAWVDSVCKWLDCGAGGVFEIEAKIKQLKDEQIDYEESLDHSETISDARNASCP